MDTEAIYQALSVRCHRWTLGVWGGHRGVPAEPSMTEAPRPPNRPQPEGPARGHSPCSGSVSIQWVVDGSVYSGDYWDWATSEHPAGPTSPDGHMHTQLRSLTLLPSLSHMCLSSRTLSDLPAHEICLSTWDTCTTTWFSSPREIRSGVLEWLSWYFYKQEMSPRILVERAAQQLTKTIKNGT